ncbi:hypothetical protein MUK42_32224, partial [Musa troglodytarum]
FFAPSQKFKILTIPNVLGLGKLNKLGFAKKHDGHKVYAMSMFDRFFSHQLENSKYRQFQISKGSHLCPVSQSHE